MNEKKNKHSLRKAKDSLLCAHLWLFIFLQLLSVDSLVSSPFLCTSVSLDKSVSLINMKYL